MDAIASGSHTNGGISFGWGLAALAFAGVAAIGGGGGGGGGSSHGGGNGGGNGGGGTTPPPTTLSGTVMAGPVLPGVGLKVRAYAANGNSLGESNVSDHGTYAMTLDAAYKGGLVRIRLIDGNGTANDYWDEVAGAKDIGDLSAVSMLKVGQANTMMLTTLTTVADHKLEAEQQQSGQALTEAQINAVNKALGDLFGINDIINDEPIPVVTANGSNNLPNANIYGKALAVLSAAEEVMNQNGIADPSASLVDILGNALPSSTGTAASEAQVKAGKDMLLDGLQKAGADGHVDTPAQQAMDDIITITLSPAALAIPSTLPCRFLLVPYVCILTLQFDLLITNLILLAVSRS